MILPIIIDTNGIVDQFTSITPEQINNMLDNVAKGLAAAYAQQLEKTAQEELKQTRMRYIKSIKLIDSGKLEATVMLDYSKDKLIKMLEEGCGPFDMKQYFLASPKVKTGKNGVKYLTIPFRMATPGAVGENEAFSFQMPSEIYNIVKNKPTTIDVPGGGSRSAGISLKEIPAEFQVKQTRASIVDNKGNELFKAYQHKSSLYEGLTKYNDNTTGQNTYRAFRRVSENSSPEAFIHPGIQRYNLMQKALGAFDTDGHVGNLIDSELSKLGLL